MAMMAINDVQISLRRDPEELRAAFGNLDSARDVADILEVPYPYLMRLTSHGADRYAYSTFTIPKRSGGTRVISAPHPTIKILQSKVNEILKLVYEPRESTHGFALDRSVATNARRHVNRRWVLNLDLLDFFPSIHFGRIRGVLIKPPYDVGPTAATVLARICSEETESGRLLPQGAPTSPIISNMICRRMDRQLSALARNSNCTYSRYADDITFSTNARSFPENIASLGRNSNDVALGADLERVITNNDFRVNNNKVRIQARNQHQEVTGLTVNKSANVPRKFIRQIRAMLHDWEMNGYEAAQDRYRREFDRRRRRGPGRTPIHFRDVVYGKIGFVKMVRGDNDPVYRSLRDRVLRLDGRSVTGDTMEPKRRYDVALSFAGKQRPIAEEIATRVKNAGYAVFYDGFEEANLWGKELTTEFEAIYRDQARYCVILVSPDYATGVWTNVERRQALSRATREQDKEYILPVVVEDAEVPGLADTVKWLSLEEVGTAGVVRNLLVKLEAAGEDDDA